MTEAPRFALASRDEMMRHHDPVRIQGYCASCEKYGVFWSCPPFTRPPLDLLPPWSHAVLITQKSWVEEGCDKAGLMELFLAARERFGRHIRELEAQGQACASLVAGHCSGCLSCTRPDGLPCRCPSLMRHSLEAVGFDVTGLAEELAGQKLHWPKEGLPDYLITVGALLCPSEEAAAFLLDGSKGSRGA